MEIYRRDISDVLGIVPKMIDFSAGMIEAEVDTLLLCTLGFEDRTHAIVSKLASQGLLKNSKILLIRYPTNNKDNERNHDYFVTAAKKCTGLFELIYSRHSIRRELSMILNQLKVSRVIFDVSTCSSYVFYPVMLELFSRPIDLRIVYCEAEKYHPSEMEWKSVESAASNEHSLYVQSFENAGFQSLGIDDIYPLSLFAETNVSNIASALVSIPNFSVMRMNAIISRDREINKTAYENIYWLIAEPPRQENKWRSDAMIQTNGLLNNKNMKPVSTLDYREIIQVLEDLWLETRYRHHLTIAPLGSKMQHLGTFFFLYLHKDVGLWLAEPKLFQAAKFSEGAGTPWLLEFGNTDHLREALDSYMRFKWQF